MKPVEFQKAYFLKLGTGGEWEESSIKKSIARIGWRDLSVEEINAKDWKKLKDILPTRHSFKNKGAATADINALQSFVEATAEDVWITFHASQLWWGKLGEPKIYEDEISRYRTMLDKWHNHDINERPLLISQIPGSIAKVQRFQGTICSIKEVDDLKRLINNQPSKAFQAVLLAKENLITEVQAGVKQLHWKDFETLVDLLFRNAGWHRISFVGETMKFADLELKERITGDLYQVQIKSKATVADFKLYAKDFSSDNFRKLYFVVHSPDKGLSKHQSKYKNVELILPERLAKMVVEFGLADWLLEKIR
jgi:hypothetical protein